MGGNDRAWVHVPGEGDFKLALCGDCPKWTRRDEDGNGTCRRFVAFVEEDEHGVMRRYDRVAVMAAHETDFCSFEQEWDEVDG